MSYRLTIFALLTTGIFLLVKNMSVAAQVTVQPVGAFVGGAMIWSALLMAGVNSKTILPKWVNTIFLLLLNPAVFGFWIFMVAQLQCNAVDLHIEKEGLTVPSTILQVSRSQRFIGGAQAIFFQGEYRYDAGGELHIAGTQVSAEAFAELEAGAPFRDVRYWPEHPEYHWIGEQKVNRRSSFILWLLGIPAVISGLLFLYAVAFPEEKS